MNVLNVQKKYLGTKLWGALEFIRIFNMTMPFTSGFVGVVMGLRGIHMSVEAVAGMFIPVFLWAGGQVFNDIFDLDVDKINTPYRAVPSGRFNLRESIAFGGILTVAGIALSVLTRSFVCQILTLCAVLMSNVYSYTLKRKGIFGHMNFAFCVLLCIYIGQSAVSGGITSFYIPLGIFLYHVAINIMASVGDVPGDKKTRVITLPVQMGRIPATLAACAFWVTGVLWSFHSSQYSATWAAVAGVVILISAYNSVLLLRTPTPGNATTTLRLFRLGTIMLQFSLVIQYLDVISLTVLTVGIGVFTVSTFLLFEVPKGIDISVKGVPSHE
jgi:geranylgeranylglycerol-phosphate geranylgeranyltransferase